MLWKTSKSLIAAACRHPASRRTLSTLRQSPGSFSIAIGPSATKRHVIEKARDALSSAEATGATVPDATVIIASRNLSPWLGDEDFVSALLQTSGPETASQHGQDISVLSAAVDGIPWPEGRHNVRDGLSVMHGSLASMLPNLWSGSSTPQVGSSAVQPSITIPLPRFATGLGARGPEVTVPLANTVFDNGRPFTMFASRWQRQQSGSPFKLTQRTEKDRQLVVPTFEGASSNVFAPLLPITQPRRIAAGLGNIIRQVELDGKSAPASKELEAVIPDLLNSRAKQVPGWTPGPIGVWALVVPEGLAVGGKVLPQLREHQDGLFEWEDAIESSHDISRLLASGCRLQRILSGGGGWGFKQGLLSLDPQTRYSTPDDEDIERFIRSFKGENSPDDVITPGSYIQFFVEPLQSPRETSIAGASALDGPKVVVGTCAAADESVRSVEDGAEVVTDYFGALSAQGMFFASGAGVSGGSGTTLEVSTKIDAPNCRVEASG